MFVYGITLHWAHVDIWELPIELICHRLFIGSFIIGCPLGIYTSLSLYVSLLRVFHSFDHLCYVFGVMRVWWVFYEILHFMNQVDIYQVWGLSNVSLESPDHCLHYHFIIGDMTFLSYTYMSRSSFFVHSRYFPSFPIISFQ